MRCLSPSRQYRRYFESAKLPNEKGRSAAVQSTDCAVRIAAFHWTLFAAALCDGDDAVDAGDGDVLDFAVGPVNLDVVDL